MTQRMQEAAKAAMSLKTRLGIIYHEGYPAEAGQFFGELATWLRVMEVMEPRLRRMAQLYPRGFHDDAPVHQAKSEAD